MQESADKAQHAAYKHVLGTKAVPKTFDKWQELKYNDSEKWAELKKQYGFKRRIKKVNKTELTAEPFAVTEVESKKGGISRNYYDENGRQTKQISNNSHGHKAVEDYGKHGEHAHDYTWEDDGNLTGRPYRELTDDERKENSDIL